MEPDEAIHITIFHTNDMHGRLEEIARLSHFARRLRSKAQAEGRQVFFWDAGDAADRRVQICSITKGAAFSQILNAMGYDLQTMGNAIALPYGPDALKAVAELANFPILAANCRDGDGPLVDGLEEYTIFPISSKVNIGVLGLTAPWGGSYEIFGLNFPDFYQLAEKIIDELHQKGASIIIVLSHLGLEDDRRLAESVTGIDLIIGAHSHDQLPNGEIHNEVMITQAGDYAHFLGKVELSVDADTSQVLSLTAQLLEVPENEAPDQAVLDAIAKAEAETQGIMARSIGTLTETLQLDHYSECDLGNMVADALKIRMGAEAAIVASGMFHTNLPAGEISIGQLHKACFSSANPALTEVRGEQILDALERGLDPNSNKLEPPSYRGTPVGIPQISGMQVWYHREMGAGKRIQQVSINGEALEMDRWYHLAHTDAEVSRDSGYLQLEDGQEPKYEVPTILPEVIEDYIRDNSPLTKPQRKRWIVRKVQDR